MSDTGFHVAWGALTCVGAGLEYAALRRRSVAKGSGTLSNRVWWLLGPRFGVRWWIGAGAWLWLSGHFLFGWPA